MTSLHAPNRVGAIAWTEPLYSREAVAEAGRTLTADFASREDRELALAVTNNWRSSHAFPLNTFQMTLRRVARNSFDSEATVAQRTKRLPSIVSKLRRLQWLSLDAMQDLGGCRAVLSDVEEARALGEYYLRRPTRHTLVQVDHYIDEPKRSGYRSIHLIFAYESDRRDIYNGLKIEMQIRSRLQHAWATAVETVDAFTAQALKSSAGERDWLRFFALMSSGIAMREGCALVPHTPHEWPALRTELAMLATRLRVVERLQGYSTAMRIIEDIKSVSRARFVTLELDTANHVLKVDSYTNQLVAAEAYSALERAAAATTGLDVVLVRVGSLDALRTAYPNYFADTSVFVDALTDLLAR
jgi:hypothetical protein